MIFKHEKAIDYCDDVRDGTHESPKRQESGDILITSKNIKDGSIDYSKATFITHDDFLSINKRSKVNKNDILFSMIGTIGLTYRVNKEPNYAIKNMGLFKVSDELKSKWLYYYLKSPQGRKQVLSKLSGSTQKFISLSDLRSLDIPYPEKTEDMERVTKILSIFDRKIEQNNELSNILLELNRSIFLDLYKNTSDEWDERLLSDVFLINMRGLSPKYAETGIPVLNQRCLRDSVIEEEAIQYHDIRESYKEIYEYTPYDILINSMGTGTLGRISQVGKLDKKYIIHSCISILRAKAEYNQLFFGEYIKSMQDTIEKMGSGSTGQTSLSNKELGKIKLKIPNEKIQEKYGALFKTNIDRVTEIIEENNTLESLRDALLSEIMSGRMF